MCVFAGLHGHLGYGQGTVGLDFRNVPLALENAAWQSG